MKIILLSILILTTITTYAHDSGIGLLYMREDNAIGLRFDSKFSMKPYRKGGCPRYHKGLLGANGYYATIAYGNYMNKNGANIRNHIRSSIGYTYHDKGRIRGSSVCGIFSIGINFHCYGEYTYTYCEIPKKAFRPLSMEFGAGAKVRELGMGFIYDPLKKEGGIYLQKYF